MNTGKTPPRAVVIKCMLQPQRQLTENKRQRQTMRDDVNHMQKPPRQAPPWPSFIRQNTLGAGGAGTGSAWSHRALRGCGEENCRLPLPCGSKHNGSGFIFFPLQFFKLTVWLPSSGALQG